MDDSAKCGAERLQEWAGRHRFLLLGLYSCVFFAATGLTQAAKPIWYDEVFTVTIARLPRTADIWTALATGTDLNPPFSYLAVRASERLFGRGLLAARLPSAIGFWVMGLSLFGFASHRLPPFHAWVALLFPSVTSALFFATEARPYGMVLGASALALLCWQGSTQRRRRGLALTGLSLSLAVAVSSHYYAVLAFVPIALGELARTVERRRVDLPVGLALAAGLVPLVFFLPLMAQARQYTVGFWGKPAWASIPAWYVDSLSGALPLLVLLALVAVGTSSCRVGFSPPSAQATSLLSLPELTAVVGFTLIPVLGVALGKFVTGAFAERYVVTGVIGLSLLAAACAQHYARGRAIAGLVVVVALGGWFLGGQAVSLVRLLPRSQGFEPSGLVEHASRDGRPVLIPDSHMYLDSVERLPPGQAARLLYVGAREFTDTMALRALGRWRPLQVVELDPFLREQRRFLVATGQDNEWSGWLVPELLRRGARIDVKGAEGGRQLLKVEMPR